MGTYALKSVEYVPLPEKRSVEASKVLIWGRISPEIDIGREKGCEHLGDALSVACTDI